MDFILEFIFEIVLESFLGLTVKNTKVKLWVRTLIWLLLAESIAILLVAASVYMYRGGNTFGGIGCGVISALLAVGFLIGGIYGHRNNWKQDLD